MTWKLKDKRLQSQLDEISNGDFSKRLKNNEINIVSSEIDPNVKYRVYFGDSPDFLANRFSVVFREDELESVPEYNPNDWNNYPEVTPPYDVMMRIKMKNGYLRAGYLKKFPDGDCWANPNGVLMCNAENAEIELFRPWED